MYLFVGKSVKILMAVLTYVYASESMLGGCFLFKLGTKYPLKAKYLDMLLYSFPNTYSSTGRTPQPSWQAAKYNLWLVLDWFVDFMKGPVKKNSPLSPNDDNSYIASALKNSWITVNLPWEIFLKCLNIGFSEKKLNPNYCFIVNFIFLHSFFILFSTDWNTLLVAWK